MMSAKGIDEMLREIVGKIDRAEIDPAQGDFEFMLTAGCLPKLNCLLPPQPDKGTYQETRRYPISEKHAHRANTVIGHLDNALSSLHSTPSASRQEITAAIATWNGRGA